MFALPCVGRLRSSSVSAEVTQLKAQVTVLSQKLEDVKVDWLDNIVA